MNGSGERRAVFGQFIRRRRMRRNRVGLAPGSLLESRPQEGDGYSVEWYRYTPESLEEGVVGSLDELPSDDTGRVTWININGIPPKEELEKLGRRFGVHSLVLEDIQNVGQRAKFENQESYLFTVFAMLWNGNGAVNDEQVSLLLFPETVVSIQERRGDIFDGLRSRLTNPASRLRRMGADYLAYAILDVAVDHYLPVLDRLEDRTQELETKTLEARGNMDEIHSLRHDLIELRRRMSPLREVLSRLRRSDSELLSPELTVYLSDLHDHGLHVLESLEALREHVATVVDLQMSSLSNSMNSVMKTLTVIASIFIPLTFVAGLYGMNFAVMPELGWKYGYPVTLGVMLCIGIGMVIYFRRKKWM